MEVTATVPQPIVNDDIILTPKAVTEVRRLMAANSIPEAHGLRLSVKGGGCSGLSYVLGFDAAAVPLASAAQAPRHPPDSAPPPARPVPDALAALVGDDPDFAVKADGELRAYLGEIHDASSAPCFSIVQGIRQVRGRYVPRTPHFFAQFLILGRLGGDEGLADPVGLVHRLCAEPEPDLRARAAALWKDLYGSEMVPARREPR